MKKNEKQQEADGVKRSQAEMKKKKCCREFKKHILHDFKIHNSLAQSHQKDPKKEKKKGITKRVNTQGR